MGAALLLAVHELWGPDEPRTLVLSHPVDLRGSLNRPVPPGYLGLYITVLASPYRVARGADFWGVAREVVADLRRQLPGGEAHLFYALQGLDKVAPGDQGVAWFSRRLRSLPPNVSLSNVGPVEAIGATTRVRTISFALCPMPFQLAFCAVNSHAGQLLANLTYDSAQLPQTDARTMAASLRDRLTAEAADGPRS